MVKLVSIIVFAAPLNPACFTYSKPQVSVDAQAERLAEVIGLLLGDGHRHEGGKLIASLNLDARWGRKRLRRILANYELKLKDRRKWWDESAAIRGRLDPESFHVDPKISKETVNEIIDYIRSNQCLDPRILLMKHEDAKTVEIITGKSEGPLNGSGAIYKARLEAGRWKVRLSSLWIS